MKTKLMVVPVPVSEHDLEFTAITVTAVFHAEYEVELKTRSYKASDLQTVEQYMEQRVCVWKPAKFKDDGMLATGMYEPGCAENGAPWYSNAYLKEFCCDCGRKIKVEDGDE